MATPKKKPTGGSRSVSAPKKRTVSTPKKGAKKPIRRGVGAVIFLILGVFAAFGYFSVDALFIDFFCDGLKGLFGYGFWFAPPILIMGAYILAFHRGRPIRLRLTCTLLVPLFFGAILHLILNRAEYEWGWNLFAVIWMDGLSVKSGGALSGVLALLCTTVFSRLGAGLIFTVATLLIGLCAFDMTVLDVWDWLQNRPHPEYEEEKRPAQRRPEPKRLEPKRPEPKHLEPKKRDRRVDTMAVGTAPPRERRKSAIDIPVDDVQMAQKEIVPPPKKDGFFNKVSNVKRPDELLTTTHAEPKLSMPETVSKSEPILDLEPLVLIPEPVFLPISEFEPIPVPIPVSPPTPIVPPAPVIEIEREPAVPKNRRTETAIAAAQVGTEVGRRLESTSTTYQYPALSLLNEGDYTVGLGAQNELKANQERLSDTIRSFGIEARIVDVTRGPSVTRYELELEQGVRLNKLTNLSDDIALALGATGVRIAPIPDKISMVGIEVPNKLVSAVQIHEVIGSRAFTDSTSKVAFAVGKDIAGNCIVGNIAKLPHLLIAGTTGSGKSVCTNSLIISLLYKSTPEEVRLIMVDPKMVELGIYNGIPHLLIPVVTDPKKAAGALQWAVTEMMKRYRTFSEVGVRDLASYNSYALRTVGVDKLPQIVVVIDELADLMLVAAKEVEESICRVAQMGRASGMHLIIATQRPSADVITGLMKANIPSRIAFAVASALESRIILDTQGAEKLVGRGDMLYSPLGSGKPLRVQGCLIGDDEVASVVECVKRSGAAEYDQSIMHEIEKHAAEKDKSSKGTGGTTLDDVNNEHDELLPSAIEVILETGQASVSMLQRRLRLGYSRAARLVDQMEERGIVGPFEGSKPRQLLITKDQWKEMQFRQNMTPAPPTVEVSEMEEFEPDVTSQSQDVLPFDTDEEAF